MAHPAFAEPILHVDMDAFFVEVERLRDPGLRGLPVMVGGLGDRGVVASASYEARRYGVHSAIPTAHAKRLCPKGAFLPTDHRRYREVSEEVFAVFRSFTPLVEGVSLDEALLDVAGLRLSFPDGAAVGEAIRQRLREQLGLPGSVGVAPNKLLGKLASETAKPDGLMRVRAGAELAFLHPLPVRSLRGVGEATHAALEQLGVRTVGDLAAIPRVTLMRRLGEAAGGLLYELARGLDPRPVEPDGPAKSVSVEQTYGRDVHGREILDGELLSQCDRLAGRLRRMGLAGSVLTLKVRFADFTTLTRSATLAPPTDVTKHLFVAARELLGRVPLGRPVRLLGVGVSGLLDGEAPRQLAIDRPPEWDELSGAVDRVRLRFGAGAIGPARLVSPPQP